MIIEKLVVEDFRQFRGKQELVFSTLKGKNVTVIHAENGFGKTALLNALLWGFYGQEGLTDDFEHPDRILHEDVARKSRDPNGTEARVTVLFRDDESRYSLTRSLTLAQQKLNAKQTVLSLKVTRDGETFPEDFPQKRIDTLMPPGIRDFLFFNGERIDHLAMAQNSELITQAIYQVLGLNLIRTTASDLRHPSVRGELSRRLREHSDQDAKALIDKHAASEADVARIKEQIENCGNERKAVEGEIRTIDAKLETNKEASALQAERRTLEERHSAQNASLQDLDARIAQAIAADAYGVFAKPLVVRGKEIVQRMRSEGKIPARVLNSFLQELLEAHRCICGTDLPDGSPQFVEVQKLLTIAGDQNFNNAVGALDNAIGVIEGGVDRTVSALQTQRTQRVQIRHDLRRLGERLEEIHEKLGSKDDDAVTALETKRQDLQLKLREHDTSFGSLQEQLKAAEKVRDDLRKQVQEVKLKEDTAILAQRQLGAADESAALLDQILELEMADLREVLNREIDQHFQKIIDREYWAELSDQFVLRIKKRLGSGETSDVIDVAQSTGQRQVTSLVFIASLVSLARQRAELPTILKGLDGGEYPMVMDSPFGQLGDAFREGVAKWIPTLAPQVVVFVSSSQYKGPVQEQLDEGGRVGRRYLLAYHGPSKRDEAAGEIRIGSQRFKQYSKSDVEFTEIRPVDLA